MTNGPFNGTLNGAKDRTDGQDWLQRTRAYAWFDSRQQTEYGTLRSYLQIGVNYDNPQVTSTNFNANRAFVQFAGFTVGTAQSFYDFFSGGASSFWANAGLTSDTGDSGWKVFAYTAQYGNGFSATFSIEEPRSMATGGVTPNAGVMNTNLGNPVIGIINPDSDRAKQRFPDLVQNWRVDQAWGSAQLMIAAQDVSGGYYAANTGALLGAGAAGFTLAPCTGPTAGFLGAGAGTLLGSEACGHPADKLGWALGGGSRHNVGTQGDYFQWQAQDSPGAPRLAGLASACALIPAPLRLPNIASCIFSP